MIRSLLRSLVVVALCGLVAQVALAGFAGTDVFLASVGRRAGAGGSSWFTTVWVHNPGSTAANVQFFFLERDRDNTAAQPYNEVIQPGDTVRYDDAVALMFGVEKFGALRVVSDQRLVVNSRIYSQSEGSEPRDSQGQFFAAVPSAFAIATGESTELLGAYQTTPKGDSQFRYNFGFVEASGAYARVRVAAADATGLEIATKEYDVRPFEARQFPLDDLLPGVDATNLRLTVSVVSGGGRVIAFGSGLANRSNDPSTFEMQFRDGLLAANSQVVHDGSLSGAGTSGSPLAVADGGIESRHLASGTAVTGVNGVTDQVTVAGGAGIAVSTAGSTVTVASTASADGAACPQCDASHVFEATTSLIGLYQSPVFTVAAGKTRYVTSLHLGAICEAGGSLDVTIWRDTKTVMVLSTENPSWASAGGAPLVFGPGTQLQVSGYKVGECESTLMINGFEF